MDKNLEFNREEFRRVVTQVRPEFYDRDHYFIIVEVDGPKARVKVVDSIVTTTTTLEGTSAIESEAVGLEPVVTVKTPRSVISKAKAKKE